MSWFETCEFCDEVGEKLCNCSSPPRFCCDNHISNHMNSRKGVPHPLEDALVDLSEEDIELLKEAGRTYKVEIIRQAISTRNTLIDSLLEKIRRIEDEFSSFIKNVLNREMEETIEELVLKEALPLVSPSSFLYTLVSFKRSNTFSLANVLKELLSASFSSLSNLEQKFCSRTASSQAVTSSVSTSSQVSSPADLSVETLSSFLLYSEPLSLSSCSSQTFGTFCLSSLSISTFYATSISGKTKENKKQTTETDNRQQTTEIDNRNINFIENHVNQEPQWELSHQIDTCSDNPYIVSIATREITCIAVSDCNRYFASASRDNCIKIWDARSSSLLRSLQGHTGLVPCVSFLGEKIVSGSHDKTIKIWEGEICINNLSFHSYRINSVCVSSSKRLIASGSNDGKVIVFDEERNQTLHTLRPSFENDELRNQTLDTLRPFYEIVTSVIFSEDDREIISGINREIKVYKTETGELLRTLNTYGYNLSLRTSGRLILFLSIGDQSSINIGMYVWDKNEKYIIAIKKCAKNIQSIDICHGIVASISYDGSIMVWDLEGERQIEIYKGHEFFGISYSSKLDAKSSENLKILEEGRCIVSAGKNGKINVWRRIN